MDDEELWQAFTTQTLTHSAWNHEAHVRVAFLHVRDVGFDLDEAHLRLRAGIIRLNYFHGLVETSKRGYFETLTRAWLWLVADAARRCHATTSEELLGQCPELLDGTIVARHYSSELLASAHARAVFVDPDGEPLPIREPRSFAGAPTTSPAG
jgi:hypothetical protein